MVEQENGELRWSFKGFESAREGQPLQEWIAQLKADLLQEHLYAIKDQLAEMQVMPRDDWGQPLFDELEGEGGISEIRIIPPIYSDENAFHYRIYGVFDEESVSYIFLHATNKKERNDKDGKKIAKRRLGELEAGTATTHEIDLD
jgi:hypothetical protein